MIDEKAPILRPISPEKPCGENLCFDPVYERIREARQEDDARLPQGIWVTKPRVANWEFVSQTCIEVLEARSKDLQIAAWLVEAQIQLQGFAGLNQGLYVLYRLADRYWEGIYAGSESQDDEAKAAPISWLNEKVADRLKWIPLVQTKTPNCRVHLEFFRPKGARDETVQAPTPNANSGVAQSHVLPPEVMETPSEFFASTLSAVEQAVQTVDKIERLYASKSPAEPPTLYRMREYLNDALYYLERMWRQRVPQEADPDVASDSEAVTDTIQAGKGRGSSHALARVPIANREQAYELLAYAADYLERLEPHSPVPYLVRRAVGWGKLPLENLLEELVRTPADLNGIKEMLGLRGK